MKTDNYSELLRAERKARKLTLEGMAELLGVEPVAVGTWERGKAYPNEDSIAKIKAATGIELGVKE